MYPPFWGHLFWSLNHAIGKYMHLTYPDQLPEEISQAMVTFTTKLCRFLPCPACKTHCTIYVSQIQPKFTTGTEVWKYFIDFHNAVNTRTNKLTVTYEEADQYLQTNIGSSLENITTVFLQEWWTAILLTTFQISATPDAPKEDEKNEYKAFLKAWVTIVPFGHNHRPTLLEFVESAQFDLKNRDTVFESITNLHNSICAHFGRFPKTVKEMKELFAQQFEHKNQMELLRATQIHEEDHKKMLALRQELEQLKGGNTSNQINASDTNNDSYKIATIVLSCVLGVLILLFVWKTKGVNTEKDERSKTRRSKIYGRLIN